MKQKQFIIYGLGERGQLYYRFFKETGLDGCVAGFCDQRYLEIKEYDGKGCYGYNEAKMMGIPFLITLLDEEVSLKIEEQIKEDGNQGYRIDDIADYMGEDKVAFNRSFIAFFHDNNMEDYYCKVENEVNMDIFWGEKSEFLRFFKQMDLTNIIELACGRGRHVLQYLDKSEKITLVDILDKNICFCRNKFMQYDKVQYYRNNGFNLEQLPSEEYTALFSYDAMVHFEMIDIYEYLKDIYRVLVSGGKVLIHHSNYDKDYRASFINSPHGRSYMNSSTFAYLAFRAGFKVLEQKPIEWGNVKKLDCISFLEKP